jgi:hypothetical protein
MAKSISSANSAEQNQLKRVKITNLSSISIQWILLMGLIDPVLLLLLLIGLLLLLLLLLVI